MLPGAMRPTASHPEMHRYRALLRTAVRTANGQPCVVEVCKVDAFASFCLGEDDIAALEHEFNVVHASIGNVVLVKVNMGWVPDPALAGGD